MSIEHSSIEVRLSRLDRVYRPTETVEGIITVKAKGGWSHNGLLMTVEGGVFLQPSSRGAGILDSITNSVRTVGLMQEEIELTPAGRVPEGATEIPFEFVLAARSGQPLLESYHGVCVNVFYVIIVECDRGAFKKPLRKEIEFIVEVSTGRGPTADPRSFSITPESLENVRASALSSLPKFKINGRLHRQHCPINMPFTGEVTVESSDSDVKSIELQLVRVETVSTAQHASREATEIQNIQIAEGDVPRNMTIPLYMIFPRLFSCPTLISTEFKIEFEVNLIIVLGDGYIVTENFPLVLHREH